MSSNYIQHTAQILSWFTLSQITLLLTGKTHDYTIEYRLRKTAKAGKLRVEQYGHQKVYLAPKLSKRSDYNEPGHIHHGVSVSQIIISFLRADPTAQVVPKKLWYGKGIIPDTTLHFSNGWVMPVEFATKDHSRLIRVYKSKVSRYISLLEDNWQVLFVMDVTEDRLEYLVRQYTPHEAFYYITYQGFTQIPLTYHLKAPCYLNGITLKREALR